MHRLALRLLMCFGTTSMLINSGCSNTDGVAKRDSYRKALAYAEFMCRVTDDVEVGKREPIPPGMIVASATGLASPVGYHVYYRSAHALDLIIAGKLSPPVLTAVTIERKCDGGFYVCADWIAPPDEVRQLTISRSSGAATAVEGQICVSLSTQHYAEGIPLALARALVRSDSEEGRFLEAAWGQHAEAGFSDSCRQISNAVRVLWTLAAAPGEEVARFADVEGKPVDFHPSVSDLDELAGGH